MQFRSKHYTSKYTPAMKNINAWSLPNYLYACDFISHYQQNTLPSVTWIYIKLKKAKSRQMIISGGWGNPTHASFVPLW